MGDIAGFNKRLQTAVSIVQSQRTKPFWLFHHNDADGLTSGAIVKKALERIGIRPRGHCLEKPYPAFLEFLFRQQIDPGSVCIFADFASGMLPTLSSLNSARTNIIVLDHHGINPVQDPSVCLVNPREFGITDCSASVVCSALALSLNPHNVDLCPLGIVGAVGDGFARTTGALSGLGNELFLLSEQEQLVEKIEADYFIRSSRLAATKLAAHLDALGSLGYFSGGPDVAIKGLLEEFDDRYQSHADQLREAFKIKLASFLQKITFRTAGSVSWFTLDQTFADYGVKTVGLVCEEIIKAGLIAPNTYLAGFQAIPDRIPGVGAFQIGQVKVSMRVPSELRGKIERGEMPGLDVILPSATRVVAGFVDACHPHAAATTVAPGMEEPLISELSRLLAG